MTRYQKFAKLVSSFALSSVTLIFLLISLSLPFFCLLLLLFLPLAVFEKDTRALSNPSVKLCLIHLVFKVLIYI